MFGLRFWNCNMFKICELWTVILWYELNPWVRFAFGNVSISQDVIWKIGYSCFWTFALMFVILQQGMGGMMYIKEDDLCSHDFSVINTSAFELWQPLILLFENLQYCFHDHCIKLPKILLFWKFSFFIFSSWLGCRGPNKEVEVWSQNNKSVNGFCSLQICVAYLGYITIKPVSCEKRNVWFLLNRLVTGASVQAVYTSQLNNWLTFQISKQNLIKSGAKSY